MTFGLAYGAMWASIDGDDGSQVLTLEQIFNGDGVAFLSEIIVSTGTGTIRTTSGLPAMLGASMFGNGGTIGLVTSGTTILRYSDRGWIGPANDTRKPNTPYEARLVRPPRLSRNLPIRPWQGRQSTSSFGVLELANADGEFDNLIADPASGRLVSLLVGKAHADSGDWTEYRRFYSLFSAQAGSWEIGQSVAKLELSSWGPVLNGLAQSNVYAGTGGINGSADLEGQPRPLVFGEVFNIAPVLIDPSNLVYQVHDGQIDAVTAVRDRGAALTLDADYADYSALTGASLVTGEYATCLALGLIRIGSRASGQLTADVRGDADPSYINTTADILARFLGTRQGITAYSTAGFGSLPSGPIGYYISDQKTVLQVLSEMVAGCGGVLGETRTGKITAYTLTDPATATIRESLGQEDVIRLTPIAAEVPVGSIEVSYRNNWTVQQSDIAGSVSAADQADFARESRNTRKVTDAAALNAGANAVGRLRGFFTTESDAQSLADDLAGLHGVERRMWSVTLPPNYLDLGLGDAVQLTHPRVGTDRRFIVVGTEFALHQNQFIATLWGAAT